MGQQGGGHAAYCYARALLDLVGEQADQVSSELQVVSQALSGGGGDVAEFFSSAIICKDNKIAALKELGARCSISDIVVNFLCVLVTENRFALLADVYTQFCLLLRQRRGQYEIQITTAQAIAPEEEEGILLMVRQEYGEPDIVTRLVDPEILGGYIVRIGSLVIDHSFVAQLEALKQMSRKAVFDIKSKM